MGKTVKEYLEHIMCSTNMSLVGRPPPREMQRGKKRLAVEEVGEQFASTPGISELINSASFFAANLYSRSIFGEDALANVSIEKVGEKLAGSVRIRSRTQGIALSLGDRITIVQRGEDR